MLAVVFIEEVTAGGGKPGVGVVGGTAEDVTGTWMLEMVPDKIPEGSGDWLLADDEGSSKLGGAKALDGGTIEDAIGFTELKLESILDGMLTVMVDGPGRKLDGYEVWMIGGI